MPLKLSPAHNRSHVRNKYFLVQNLTLKGLSQSAAAAGSAPDVLVINGTSEGDDNDDYKSTVQERNVKSTKLCAYNQSLRVATCSNTDISTDAYPTPPITPCDRLNGQRISPYPSHTDPLSSLPRGTSHGNATDAPADFADLRDPFASPSPPRVCAARLLSPVEFPVPPSSRGRHSSADIEIPMSPRLSSPLTRMSAWGRLQFPVRLPASTTAFSAGTDASGMFPVANTDGTTTTVVRISGPRTPQTQENATGRRKGRMRAGCTAQGQKGDHHKRREGRSPGSPAPRLDIDGEVESSALLAQRLLRRLQGHGSPGSNSPTASPLHTIEEVNLSVGVASPVTGHR